MKEIICKWYQKLNFPQIYDEAFQSLLQGCPTTKWTTVEEYDENAHTPQENLLAYLYFCEALSERYEKACIAESILLETLSDIVIWTNVWFSIKNELGLGETTWLKRHLSFRLFRLGRLQFCLGTFAKSYPKLCIKENENVVEVHIPEGGKMSPEECSRSFARAKVFFATYFPDFSYRYYSCHSWLLDEGLAQILGENTNICRFGARFEILENDVSDAILKYVFRWDATRENVNNYPANTALAKAVKEHLQKGASFYETLGVIDKDKYILGVL